MSETLTQPKNEIKNDVLPTNNIIIYNDSYNTFEHAINCMIKYCKHTLEQAEQCAMIIHNNGKCSVKQGTLEKLKPICEALQENDLSAEIQ